MNDKIQVAIRVRQLIDKEKHAGLHSNWCIEGDRIYCNEDSSNGRKPTVYTFDHIFDETSVTWDVFNHTCKQIVDASLNGFNGTIFAYGQSSSGKTHTITGSQLHPGIIPLAVDEIFNQIANVNRCFISVNLMKQIQDRKDCSLKCVNSLPNNKIVEQSKLKAFAEDNIPIPDREYLIRVSYMEIYNEKLTDLLKDDDTNLKLQEDTDRNVKIVGIHEEMVHNHSVVSDVLKKGNNKRHTAATKQNDRSSRSHCILRFVIESRVRGEEDQAVKVSNLYFVDLAGSEKAADNSGERFREGCSINKSLFTLSNVIRKLSGDDNFQHASYRDSKLTRILQNALGGNSKTAIICTITPAHIEESESTLKFASRAKTIKNEAHINEVVSEAALLKRYLNKIKTLEKQVKEWNDGHLAKKLEANEAYLKEQEETIEKFKKMILISGTVSTDEPPPKKRRRETWAPGKRGKPRLSLPGASSFAKAPFDLEDPIIEEEEQPAELLCHHDELEPQVTFQTEPEVFQNETIEVNPTVKELFELQDKHELLLEEIQKKDKELEELKEFKELERQMQDETIKELTDKVKDWEGSQQWLEEELMKAQQERNSLRQKVESLTRQLKSVEAGVGLSEKCEQLATAEKKIHDLNSDIDVQKTRYEFHIEQLKKKVESYAKMLDEVGVDSDFMKQRLLSETDTESEIEHVRSAHKIKVNELQNEIDMLVLALDREKKKAEELNEQYLEAFEDQKKRFQKDIQERDEEIEIYMGMLEETTSHKEGKETVTNTSVGVTDKDIEQKLSDYEIKVKLLENELEKYKIKNEVKPEGLVYDEVSSPVREKEHVHTELTRSEKENLGEPEVMKKTNKQERQSLIDENGEKDFSNQNSENFKIQMEEMKIEFEMKLLNQKEMYENLLSESVYCDRTEHEEVKNLKEKMEQYKSDILIKDVDKASIETQTETVAEINSMEELHGNEVTSCSACFKDRETLGKTCRMYESTIKEIEDELANFKGTIKKLQDEIEQLQDANKSLKKDKIELMDEKIELKKNLDVFSKDIENLKESLKESDKEVEGLRAVEIENTELWERIEQMEGDCKLRTDLISEYEIQVTELKEKLNSEIGTDKNRISEDDVKKTEKDFAEKFECIESEKERLEGRLQILEEVKDREIQELKDQYEKSMESTVNKDEVEERLRNLENEKLELLAKLQESMEQMESDSKLSTELISEYEVQVAELKEKLNSEKERLEGRLQILEEEKNQEIQALREQYEKISESTVNKDEVEEKLRSLESEKLELLIKLQEKDDNSVDGQQNLEVFSETVEKLKESLKEKEKQIELLRAVEVENTELWERIDQMEGDSKLRTELILEYEIQVTQLKEKLNSEKERLEGRLQILEEVKDREIQELKDQYEKSMESTVNKDEVEERLRNLENEKLELLAKLQESMEQMESDSKLSTELISEYEVQVAELKEKLNSEKERLEGRLLILEEEKNQEIQALREQYEKISESTVNKDEVEEKLRSLESEKLELLIKLQEKDDNSVDEQQNLEVFSETVEKLKESLKEKEKEIELLRAAGVEKTELWERIEQMESDSQLRTDLISEYEIQVTELKEKLNSEKERLESRLQILEEEKNQEIQALRQQYEKNSESTVNKDEVEEKLRSLESEKLELMTKLQEKDEHTEEGQQKIDLYAEIIEELKGTIKELEKDNSDLNIKNEKIQRENTVEKENHMSEISLLRERLEKLECEHKLSQELIEEYEIKVGELKEKQMNEKESSVRKEKMEELEKCYSEKELALKKEKEDVELSLKGQISKCELKIQEMNNVAQNDKDKLEQLEKDKAELKEQIHLLETEKDKAKSMIESLEEDKEMLERNLPPDAIKYHSLPENLDWENKWEDFVREEKRKRRELSFENRNLRRQIKQFDESAKAKVEDSLKIISLTYKVESLTEKIASLEGDKRSGYVAEDHFCTFRQENVKIKGEMDDIEEELKRRKQGFEEVAQNYEERIRKLQQEIRRLNDLDQTYVGGFKQPDFTDEKSTKGKKTTREEVFEKANTCGSSTSGGIVDHFKVCLIEAENRNLKKDIEKLKKELTKLQTQTKENNKDSVSLAKEADQVKAGDRNKTDDCLSMPTSVSKHRPALGDLTTKNSTPKNKDLSDVSDKEECKFDLTDLYKKPDESLQFREMEIREWNTDNCKTN